MLSSVHNLCANPMYVFKYQIRQIQYSGKGLIWREGRGLNIFFVLGREEFDKRQDKSSIIRSKVNWKLV